MTFPCAQHLADLDCTDEHHDNPGRGGEQGGARRALGYRVCAVSFNSVLKLTKPSLRPDFRRLTLLRWADERRTS